MNRRPNPSAGKFTEGTRVFVGHIEGFSEKYRYTLAKYRVIVFF